MKYIEFDWAELNRDFLFGMWYDLEHKIIGHVLTGQQLFKIITGQIHKYLPIRARKIKNKSMSRNGIAIGGSYCFESDEQRKKSITIDFYFKNFDQPLQIKRSTFLKCGILFADTVLHEIIHMRQFRRRAFNSRPAFKSKDPNLAKRQQQAYLGCLDEVDAYAFNISCELMDYFNWNEKEAIEYLNHTPRTKNRENSYQNYLKSFDYDHNHVIIKKLKKKIVRYFPRAKQGRPFSNSDWIFY